MTQPGAAPNPRKGGKPKPAAADVHPTEEENFPKSDPTRRSAERKMSEPSNVRPPEHPTPERPTRREHAEETEGE